MEVNAGARSKVAPAALSELKNAFDLFEAASEYGGRAVKFLVSSLHAFKLLFLTKEKKSLSSNIYKRKLNKPFEMLPKVFHLIFPTIFSNHPIQEEKQKMNYLFLAVKRILSQLNPHPRQLPAPQPPRRPNHPNHVIHHRLRLRVFILVWCRSLISLMGLSPYFDNAECIRLLQNVPGGLIHIMDDQARRQPKKTDHTMVEAFTKRWGNHSSFKTGNVDRSGNPTFTISHYNGAVTYSAEGFLDRNLDAINPDFVSLLRGAADGLEVTGAVNPFVKGLFSAKAIATQAHPRDEDTIVAAQQAVKPMRAPSTRRKNTTKCMPTVMEGGDMEEQDREEDDNNPPMASLAGGASPCVADELKAALDTLFETIEETQPWYVFCVNPNDSQLPNQLEGRSVKGQVKAVGMTEMAKRCVNVFEVGMTPEEFCDRYREGLTAGGVTEVQLAPLAPTSS